MDWLKRFSHVEDPRCWQIGRNKYRCVDSYGRSTVVDSAALHTAFSRHQAAHRKAEIRTAKPAATQPCGAKREQRNRGADLPVRAVCGGDLSITETDSKALNRLRGAQLRKIGYSTLAEHQEARLDF